MCRVQRLVVFVRVLVRECTAAIVLRDQYSGPYRTPPLLPLPKGRSLDTSLTQSSSSPSAHCTPAVTAASVTCVTTRPAMAAACKRRGSRGQTVSVLASVRLDAAHKSSVQVDKWLSTSLGRGRPHVATTTAPPLCLLSPRIPTPSSSPTGARRAAGGVHADEAVCVGPQADARVSSSAAYRQPSTTVTDSGPAASTEVPRDSGAEAATRTAGGSGSVTRAATGVPANRRLPSALLDQLPSLSHQPRRLPTIADGRCSVAAVLLACGKIKDAHTNKQGRQTIDAERRRLGRVMVGKWGEAEWIRRVPIHVRGAHMPYDNTDPCGICRLSSHKLYHQLLTERAPTEWLDHGVFCLASAEYEVGVFVMYQADGGTWCCTRIGEQADRHIVLYQVWRSLRGCGI